MRVSSLCRGVLFVSTVAVAAAQAASTKRRSRASSISDTSATPWRARVRRLRPRSPRSSWAMRRSSTFAATEPGAQIDASAALPSGQAALHPSPFNVAHLIRCWWISSSPPSPIRRTSLPSFTARARIAPPRYGWSNEWWWISGMPSASTEAAALQDDERGPQDVRRAGRDAAKRGLGLGPSAFVYAATADSRMVD